MRHLLGYGPKAYNLEKGVTEHMMIIEVSQDVLDWLQMHDMRKAEDGGDIYIANALEYHYLGPSLNLTNKCSTNEDT